MTEKDREVLEHTREYSRMLDEKIPDWGGTVLLRCVLKNVDEHQEDFDMQFALAVAIWRQVVDMVYEAIQELKRSGHAT